jgi:AcrR family transcriptional regulator
MHQDDRRVKRTRKLLLDTLIALSLEHGYDAVTIRDITERADIAYSTFFRHYADKDSLLQAVAEEAVATLNHLIRQLPRRLPQEEGQLLFQHAKENEAFYRVILAGQGSNRVLQSIQQSIQQMMVNDFRIQAHSLIPVEIVANHLVTAILALIKWWLDHNMPFPVEEMARIYTDLIIMPTRRAAFGDG